MAYEEVTSELIMQHTSTRVRKRFSVTLYELGFYIRIDNATEDGPWRLENITTRNKVDKVNNYMNRAQAELKQSEYRLLKHSTIKVRKNPKTQTYIVK